MAPYGIIPGAYGMPMAQPTLMQPYAASVYQPWQPVATPEE